MDHRSFLQAAEGPSPDAASAAAAAVATHSRSRWLPSASLLLVLALIALPQPTAAAARQPPFDASCSRQLSREAASISKADILDYAVRLDVPVDGACPLLSSRSRYQGHELLKERQHRNLWRCRSCGKRFRSEFYLDWHLDRRHAVNATVRPRRETSCFADWCGLLGCPGLGQQEEEGEEASEEGDVDDGAIADLPDLDLEQDAGGISDPESPSHETRHTNSSAVGRGGGIVGLRRALANLLRPSRTPVHHIPIPADALSKEQLLQRDRCGAILLACFPVPVATKPLLGASANGHPANAPAVPIPRGSYGALLRAAIVPMDAEQRRALVVETLFTEFCERPSAEKAAARREKAAQGVWNVLFLVCGSLVGVCVVCALLAALYAKESPEDHYRKHRKRSVAARDGCPPSARSAGSATGSPEASPNGSGGGRGPHILRRRNTTNSLMMTYAYADGSGDPVGAYHEGGGGSAAVNGGSATALTLESDSPGRWEFSPSPSASPSGALRRLPRVGFAPPLRGPPLPSLWEGPAAVGRSSPGDEAEAVEPYR